jgi:choline kinase
MYYIIVASIPDKAYKDISEKALLLIDQKTLLYHQIHNLLSLHQNSRVLVCCTKEHESVYSKCIKGKKITWLPYRYNEYSNFGECIKQSIDYIPKNESFAIVNLASIISPQIFKKINTKTSHIIVSKSNKSESNIGCTINSDGMVEFVFYDLDNTTYDYLYIDKKDNEKFKHIVHQYIKPHMCLFEIINQIILSNIQIKAEFTKDYIIQFSDPNQFKKLNTTIRKIYHDTTV